MKKSTYYLVRNDYATEEEYQNAKEIFSKMGFRVVTFKDGPKEANIQDGIKAIIKNHMSSNCH